MWTTSLTRPRSPHETRPEPDPDPHRAGRRRHEPPAPDGPGRRHPGCTSPVVSTDRSLALAARPPTEPPVVSTGRSLALAARPPTPLLDHLVARPPARGGGG